MRFSPEFAQSLALASVTFVVTDNSGRHNSGPLF
jgi:hypothetical protein